MFNNATQIDTTPAPLTDAVTQLFVAAYTPGETTSQVNHHGENVVPHPETDPTTEANTDDEDLKQALIEKAKSLGLVVVAEGSGTVEQAQG